jgi:hypothetical protein
MRLAICAKAPSGSFVGSRSHVYPVSHALAWLVRYV